MWLYQFEEEKNAMGSFKVTYHHQQTFFYISVSCEFLRNQVFETVLDSVHILYILWKALSDQGFCDKAQ